MKQQPRQQWPTIISGKRLFRSVSINRPLSRFRLLLVMRVLVKDAVLMLVFYQYRPFCCPPVVFYLVV
jgi:hypothetical protein